MTSYRAPQTRPFRSPAVQRTVKFAKRWCLKQLTTNPPVVLILSHTNPDHDFPDYLKSTLILSSYLRIVLLSSLFPSGFPPETCRHLSSTPYVLHSSPISPYFNTIKLILLVKSPHYAVFSIPSPPFRPKRPPPYPNLEQLRPTPLRLNGWPCYRSTLNCRQNCISGQLNV